MVDIGDYLDIENNESYLSNGFTLALVEFDGDPRQVLERAGLAVRELRPDEDPLDGTVDGEATRVGRLGQWLTLLALRGVLLSLPEHAAQASMAGRLVAIHLSANMDMAFLVAERGEVVRYFDPVLDEPGEGDGDPLPGEDGLPFGGEHAPVLAASFALMERTTGQRITRNWLLDETPPTVVVTHLAR